MIFSGLDIGSRTTALVSVSESGEIGDWKVVDTGYDPKGRIAELSNGLDPGSIVATGYGRSLAKESGVGGIITEIMACALGANELDSLCDTVLDIGGQDIKVISLNGRGEVEDFEMNDRCAAGTGKFMEIMANALGCEVEIFGDTAGDSSEGLKINSMCTVFAESEVISLITSGEDRGKIVRALHESIVERCASLANRLDIGERVMVVGGAAKNGVLVDLLSKRLNRKVSVPDEPQIAVALGAAVEARRRFCK